MTWHHFFSWQAQYFRQVEWKNRKTHWYEAVSSALNVPFLKEVSQNCFIFDLANLENWGCLADLLRFWRCQLQKLRTSHRIASFLTLSSSENEEVSQNSFVFKLADRQIDGSKTTTTTTTTLQLQLYKYNCNYNILSRCFPPLRDHFRSQKWFLKWNLYGGS